MIDIVINDFAIQLDPFVKFGELIEPGVSWPILQKLDLGFDGCGIFNCLQTSFVKVVRKTLH